MPNSTRGFTLVEIMVAVLIIGVITSLVVFNHRDFNDNLGITNLAFEVALLVREAQIAGVSTRGNPGGGADAFDHAYGIYTRPETDNRKLVFYIDLLDDDRRYTFNGEETAAFECDLQDECLSIFEIERENVIERFCWLQTSGQPPSQGHCSGTGSDSRSVSVSFLRPKPDADFYFMNQGGGEMYVGENTDGALLCLKSPLGRRKMVEILKTGQISVKDSICPQ